MIPVYISQVSRLSNSRGKEVLCGDYLNSSVAENLIRRCFDGLGLSGSNLLMLKQVKLEINQAHSRLSHAELLAVSQSNLRCLHFYQFYGGCHKMHGQRKFFWKFS